MSVLKTALGEIGVKEIVGSKHNKRVIEYFKKVGHSWVKNDETAWCAAFVGWVLETSGIRSTRKLNARSYLEFGKSTTKPEPGDIVVFWRESKRSWKGHVGFFIREEGDTIYVLGGNQSNKVNIAEYPKYRLLGYRKVQESGQTILTCPLALKDADKNETINHLIDLYRK